jgi:general stress protein 26
MDTMTAPDDFTTLSREIWNALQHAVVRRDHGWRTPVLATTDAEGLPDARTVVLRAADPVTQTLRVFSDRRSPKVAQLKRNPEAVLVFWCPQLSWQLRARVAAQVDESSEQLDQIWADIRETGAAADYLTAEAPGDALSSQAPRAADEHALCVLEFRTQSLDWLMLSREGHRRARLEDGHLVWLTP